MIIILFKCIVRQVPRNKMKWFLFCRSMVSQNGKTAHVCFIGVSRWQLDVAYMACEVIYFDYKWQNSSENLMNFIRFSKETLMMHLQNRTQQHIRINPFLKLCIRLFDQENSEENNSSPLWLKLFFTMEWNYVNLSSYSKRLLYPPPLSVIPFS